MRLKKNLQKVYYHSTGDEMQKTINFGGKLSFILSFLFLNASTAATYIFTHPNFTSTIISLEP
jgi:hypothetical protein